MRKKPSDHRAVLGTTILHLRSGRAISRSSLARALGASASTVSLYVDQLIAENYVNETGLGKANVGRPQRLLALRANAGWFAGVEFNAQRVQIVSVDFSGRVLSTASHPLDESPDALSVQHTLIELISQLHTRHASPLLGIGVGVPGLVDRQKGIGRYFSFVSHWRDVPVSQFLHKHFAVPVTIENNLRVIALAERWFGGGGDLSDYVILGPRSGFGMAIMHDGQLLHGAHEVAGEIGLWTWPQPGGDAALHDMLSATAVYRRMAGLSAKAQLPHDLAAALAAHANPQSAAWKSTVKDFAGVIRSVQLLIDPEVFFLHGPLLALGPRFCADIEQAVLSLQPKLPNLQIKVIPSSLGDDAGALGAASVAMEVWQPKP